MGSLPISFWSHLLCFIRSDRRLKRDVKPLKRTLREVQTAQAGERDGEGRGVPEGASERESESLDQGGRTASRSPGRLDFGRWWKGQGQRGKLSSPCGFQNEQIPCPLPAQRCAPHRGPCRGRHVLLKSKHRRAWKPGLFGRFGIGPRSGRAGHLLSYHLGRGMG